MIRRHCNVLNRKTPLVHSDENLFEMYPHPPSLSSSSYPLLWPSITVLPPSVIGSGGTFLLFVENVPYIYLVGTMFLTLVYHDLDILLLFPPFVLNRKNDFNDGSVVIRYINFQRMIFTIVQTEVGTFGIYRRRNRFVVDKRSIIGVSLLCDWRYSPLIWLLIQEILAGEGPDSIKVICMHGMEYVCVKVSFIQFKKRRQ